MDIVTTTETIGKVMDRQGVVPTWMRAIAEEHGVDAVVEVVTKRTPFGNFVVSATPVTEGE